MLLPKRVKYRRVHRGRLTGKAYRGSKVSYGDFGLQALERIKIDIQKYSVYKFLGYIQLLYLSQSLASTLLFYTLGKNAETIFCLSGTKLHSISDRFR